MEYLCNIYGISGPSREHRGIQYRSGGMIACLFAKCLPTARSQNIALGLSLNFAKRPSAPHHPFWAQMLIAAYRFCLTCAGDCVCRKKGSGPKSNQGPPASCLSTRPTNPPRYGKPTEYQGISSNIYGASMELSMDTSWNKMGYHRISMEYH